MELMRRRRSGRVSPGREAEESRAPAGDDAPDEAGEPEEEGPMGGGAIRETTEMLHGQDQRQGREEVCRRR